MSVQAQKFKIFEKKKFSLGVRSHVTVSGVVEDLKFKISEGSDPNWCFPDSAQLAVSVTETANWAESGKHQFGS